jgi:hypothetical protein
MALFCGVENDLQNPWYIVKILQIILSLAKKFNVKTTVSLEDNFEVVKGNNIRGFHDSPLNSSLNLASTLTSTHQASTSQVGNLVELRLKLKQVEVGICKSCS